MNLQCILCWGRVNDVGVTQCLKILCIKTHEKDMQSCIKQDKIVMYIFDVVCMTSKCSKRKCEKHWIEHFTLETAERWITDWQGEIMEERGILSNYHAFLN